MSTDTTWQLTAAHPAVSGHRVQRHAVVPMAYWLFQVVQCLEAAAGRPIAQVAQVLLRRPVVLGADAAVQPRIRFDEAAGGFVVAVDDVVVEGRWRAEGAIGTPVPQAPRGGTVHDADAFYAAAAAAGFDYGPAFRRVAQLRDDGSAWSATLAGASATDEGLAQITTWDAVLQTGAVLAARDGGTWLPFRVDALALTAGAAPVTRVTGAWHAGAAAGTRVADLAGWGDDGQPASVVMRGVHYRRVDDVAARLPHRAPSPLSDGDTALSPERILATLGATPPDARHAVLVQFIDGQLLDVLQWPASRRPELARGFVAIGLDSLMSVDLQFRLQTALRFALPIGEGFEATTVDDLAAYLLAEHVHV